MTTVLPKPDAGPAEVTTPSAAATIGAPRGAAMSMPGWNSPGRGPKGEASGPCAGSTQGSAPGAGSGAGRPGVASGDGGLVSGTSSAPGTARCRATRAAEEPSVPGG